MLKITWTEKRTDQSIVEELGTERELLGRIMKSKLAHFAHVCRERSKTLVKTAVQERVQGNRGRGRPRMSYEDNLLKWTRQPIGAIVRAVEDREGWRKVVGSAVEAAKRHT
jgi:hypothetical protein